MNAQPALSSFDLVLVATSDPHGRLFGRWVTPAVLADAAERGLPVSSGAFAYDAAQEIADNLRVTGYHTGWHDVLLLPEWDTLRPVPWLTRTALVFADVADQHGHRVAAVAPRGLLKRQVDALRELGLEARVGAELEFYLFCASYDEARAAGYRNLAPSVPYRAQDLVDHRTLESAPFFARLERVLAQMGVPLHSIKPEWGLGQWELSLLHADPVALADRHALIKLAVKAAARQAGLAATFMAKPFADHPGSSCHLHLSLRTLASADSADGVGAGEGLLGHAIGGVLTHVPALLLAYAPTVNSYKRYSVNAFSGHGASWGVDNRTVTCRVVEGGPDARRFEFRVPGADANPYLAIAGLLASAADGVRQRRDPGPPVTGNAYEQVRSPFPASLGAAAAAFRDGTIAAEALGPEAADHLAALAEFEWAQSTRSVSSWETERYFEIV
jgi:glutamine synthetase